MKKKSTLEKLTPWVLGTCMLTFVAACGSDDDDSGSGSSSGGSQEQQTEGTYRVVLRPVNPSVAGTAEGEGTFTIEGDEFRAVVNVNGAPAGDHDQHIHVGRRCPTIEQDDANGDGIVDYVEASAAAGGVLIPLDSDLRSQDAGSDNTSGSSYSYNESASLLAMMADLRLPDTDLDDDEVKLGLDEELNLAGRVVEVHGVPESTNLPDTVRDSDDDEDNDDAHEDLPILCGVIERVADGGTTGDTGTTTGDTGTTTGDTGTTTGDTGTTTGDTGTTTGDTGTTTGDTGTTGTTTGETGTTTGP